MNRSVYVCVYGMKIAIRKLKYLQNMWDLILLQSQLPGFYDPCVGEDKQLLVQYLFHTQTHECVIQDDAPLRIPVSCKTLLICYKFVFNLCVIIY